MASEKKPSAQPCRLHWKHLWETKKKGAALGSRIREYCTDGSHKADRINRALERGYELWVRVKVASGRQPKERAGSMENDLLDKYDYMWNIRRNKGRKRYLPA